MERPETFVEYGGKEMRAAGRIEHAAARLVGEGTGQREADPVAARHPAAVISARRSAPAPPAWTADFRRDLRGAADPDRPAGRSASSGAIGWSTPSSRPSSMARPTRAEMIDLEADLMLTGWSRAGPRRLSSIRIRPFCATIRACRRSRPLRSATISAVCPECSPGERGGGVLRRGGTRQRNEEGEAVSSEGGRRFRMQRDIKERRPGSTRRGRPADDFPSHYRGAPARSISPAFSPSTTTQWRTRRPSGMTCWSTWRTGGNGGAGAPGRGFRSSSRSRAAMCSAMRATGRSAPSTATGRRSSTRSMWRKRARGAASGSALLARARGGGAARADACHARRHRGGQRGLAAPAPEARLRGDRRACRRSARNSAAPSTSSSCRSGSSRVSGAG